LNIIWIKTNDLILLKIAETQNGLQENDKVLWAFLLQLFKTKIDEIRM
jgi:hypothetical protein